MSTEPYPSPDHAVNGTKAPSPLVIRVLLALLCLIWGSTWIVIKGGLRDLPPFTSSGVRFVLAAFVMIGVAAFLGRREDGSAPPRWMSVFQGTTNFAIPYGTVYYAETILPSGLVSLLFGVYPMFQAISGHFFLAGERLRKGQWLGFGGALVGLAVLFRTDIQSIGGVAVATALLVLLSPISATVGITVIKKYGADVKSTQLNRNGMAVAAAILMMVALMTERGASVQWTAPAIGSVLYLALIGTVLSFSLYFWLLRYTPAHILGLVAYVTPVIALFLGWAVDREPVTAFTLMGAALILGGVVLVSWQPRSD
jgi:drug/metabolite transporter (DMT)-like permease